MSNEFDVSADVSTPPKMPQGPYTVVGSGNGVVSPPRNSTVSLAQLQGMLDNSVPDLLMPDVTLEPPTPRNNIELRSNTPEAPTTLTPEERQRLEAENRLAVVDSKQPAPDHGSNETGEQGTDDTLEDLLRILGGDNDPQPTQEPSQPVQNQQAPPPVDPPKPANPFAAIDTTQIADPVLRVILQSGNVDAFNTYMAQYGAKGQAAAQQILSRADTQAQAPQQPQEPQLDEVDSRAFYEFSRALVEMRIDIPFSEHGGLKEIAHKYFFEGKLPYYSIKETDPEPVKVEKMQRNQAIKEFFVETRHKSEQRAMRSLLASIKNPEPQPIQQQQDKEYTDEEIDAYVQTNFNSQVQRLASKSPALAIINQDPDVKGLFYQHFSRSFTEHPPMPELTDAEYFARVADHAMRRMLTNPRIAPIFGVGIKKAPAVTAPNNGVLANTGAPTTPGSGSGAQPQPQVSNVNGNKFKPKTSILDPNYPAKVTKEFLAWKAARG